MPLITSTSFVYIYSYCKCFPLTDLSTCVYWSYRRFPEAPFEVMSPMRPSLTDVTGTQVLACRRMSPRRCSKGSLHVRVCRCAYGGIKIWFLSLAPRSERHPFVDMFLNQEPARIYHAIWFQNHVLPFDLQTVLCLTRFYLLSGGH